MLVCPTVCKRLKANRIPRSFYGPIRAHNPISAHDKVALWCVLAGTDSSVGQQQNHPDRSGTTSSGSRFRKSLGRESALTNFCAADGCLSFHNPFCATTC